MATTQALRPAQQGAGEAVLATAKRARPRWYVEVAIVAFFYGAYERSRAAAPTHPGLALRHAHGLIVVERSLHLGAETAVNRVFAAHEWLGALGGYYYATMHFIVTVGVLVWLYVRHPELYSRARTMLVLASFAALVVYVLYPVAPPRLAVPGMTDILVTHNVFGAAHAGKSGGFVNIYAAMPSLHVGWAVWSALWVSRAQPTSRWRQAAWLYPLATTVVVLGTANHYVLDALAGLSVMLAAAVLTSVALRTAIRRRVDDMIRVVTRPDGSPCTAHRARRRHSGGEGTVAVHAKTCELCAYEGPRRYLVTFVSMLTASGLDVDLPADIEPLDGVDLGTPVSVTLPVMSEPDARHRSLDDVIDDFSHWGAQLATVTHVITS